MRWENKTVWITGASSGIGKALAEQLNSEGANVAISARREDLLADLKSKVTDPNRILVVPLDLADQSHFAEATRQVTDHFGTIDVLINNGGISQRSLAMETDEKTERRIMEVDYFGHVALSKSVIPVMRKQGKGQIVVISSLSGKFGFFLRSSYAAAKHALHGYFESLRLEEEEHGIKVTIVCPGLIKTNISLNAVNAEGNPHGRMDKKQDEGMSPKVCASKILEAVHNEKLEVVVGGKERWSVLIKRLFPGWFHNRIRKESHK